MFIRICFMVIKWTKKIRKKQSTIAVNDSYKRKKIKILDTEIAYVEAGKGNPIIFLHGNPTSSYLWRNIIPEAEGSGRCLAPDLVGMGQSGRAARDEYRFVDHVRYMDAWFDALGLSDVILVVHDWGSALGFHWAERHRDRVKGIVYMEAFVRPVTWKEWPRAARGVFKMMRSRQGENFILEKNGFIEDILPASVIRPMKEEEMEVYRKPFSSPGEARRPLLVWPREVPLSGKPDDVTRIIKHYSEWLADSKVPKLFVNAEPGMILTGPQREFCRSWPDQEEITVKGLHYLQEDSPKEIGKAIRGFVKKIQADKPQ